MTDTVHPLLESLTARERRALKPPERLKVSEWAERCRELGTDEGDHPGAWRNAQTPYLVEVMDAFCDPRVEALVFVAGSQVGKSEACLNMIGYSFDQDPGNSMLVLPNEKSLKYFNKRVSRMMRNTPRLQALMDGRAKEDRTLEQIATDQMAVYFALAGSPADLASRPCRRVFLDEVDKYPDHSREADPVSLARERLKTYRDGKAVLASTPTTRDGIIWNWWEQSDQHRLHVPCPHCGFYQVLSWDRIRWPKDRTGDDIVRERLAHYVCQDCEKPIEEGQRHRMLHQGVWAPQGARVEPDGRVVGAMPSSIRGFQVSALYSPFVTWSQCVREFQKGDHQNFTNSWLGWVWEEVSESVNQTKLESLVESYPRDEVPRGAQMLTAGVDVQKNGMFYEVRAWGADEESWLVRAGFVKDWDELDEVLTTGFAREGRPEPEYVLRACIDSGYRTDEVYAFCQDRPDLAVAVKGRANGRLPLQTTVVGQNRSTAAMEPYAGLSLTTISTDHFKTRLMRLMNTAGSWHVHENPEAAWLRHMASEHRVRIRRGGKLVETWQTKGGSSANHWWDCAVYSLVAAELIGLRELEAEDTQPEPPPRRRDDKGESRWLRRRARRPW